MAEICKSSDVSSEREPEETSVLSCEQCELDTVKLNVFVTELQAVPGQFINENDFMSPVVIKNCNGMDSSSWTFNTASVTFDEQNYFPLCYWFPYGAEWLLNNLKCTSTKEENDWQKLKPFASLVEYIYDISSSNGKHFKCLQSVRKTKNEASVQAALALHLFSPLVADRNCLMDAHLPKRVGTCLCGEQLKLGDTSLGNTSVWHGSADIVVGRSVVKVQPEGDESTELYEDDVDVVGEPAFKKHRSERDFSDDDSESDEHINQNTVVLQQNLKNKLTLSQVIAETIVNAFCEVKHNKQLSDQYIPSFLASEREVRIVMYNCERDKLVLSDPLSLWRDTSKLHVGTIIYIWLALNFDKYKNTVAFEGGIPSCNFRQLVNTHSKYDVYDRMVDKPCIKAESIPAPKIRICALDPQFDSTIARLRALRDRANVIFFSNIVR